MQGTILTNQLNNIMVHHFPSLLLSICHYKFTPQSPTTTTFLVEEQTLSFIQLKIKFYHHPLSKIKSKPHESLVMKNKIKKKKSSYIVDLQFLSYQQIDLHKYNKSLKNKMKSKVKELGKSKTKK